jgi:hypothetical protein
MRRRTFDALVSAGGLLVAAVLILAGALAIWGYNFTANQVTTQLKDQKIVFPAKGSTALTSLPASDEAAMNQYTGQQLTNGYQANTYANNFIAVHLNEIGHGKTYSQLSAAALANPANLKLAKTVETVFRGTTLRGLLLNAYAFWEIAQILLAAAIGAFIAGGLMLVLAILGFLHLRRTAPEAQI